LFVCSAILCVCTIEDFFAEDKDSGVKFCTVVYRRPGQGISHSGKLAPPEALNRTNRLVRIARVARAMAAQRVYTRWAAMVRATQATRRIGMCGYTVVPEDGVLVFIYLFIYL